MWFLSRVVAEDIFVCPDQVEWLDLAKYRIGNLNRVQFVGFIAKFCNYSRQSRVPGIHKITRLLRESRTVNSFRLTLETRMEDGSGDKFNGNSQKQWQQTRREVEAADSLHSSFSIVIESFAISFLFRNYFVEMFSPESHRSNRIGETTQSLW